MTTLTEALTQATLYWEAKGPSSRMMPIRARACVEALPKNQRLELLGPKEATTVLTHLSRTKSKGSIGPYFAAFKRAVELAGGDTRGWPKAVGAPKKCREPLSELDLERLADALQGYAFWHSPPLSPDYVILAHRKEDGAAYVRCGNWETWDLLELLRGTGLRVEREALNGEALRWNPESKLLHITGKGSHERMIPVERAQTVELLNSPGRMAKMRRLGYSGHIKRWQFALNRLRIRSLRPTPHAVRHYYATEAYRRSGHNLRVVQQLLGHSDINTTARYLGVNMDELRSAVA